MLKIIPFIFVFFTQLYSEDVKDDFETTLLVDIVKPDTKNVKDPKIDRIEEAIDFEKKLYSFLDVTWDFSVKNYKTSSFSSEQILNLKNQDLEDFFLKSWNKKKDDYYIYNPAKVWRIIEILNSINDLEDSSHKQMYLSLSKKCNDAVVDIYKQASKYEKIGRKKERVNYLKRAYYYYYLIYPYNDVSKKVSQLKSYTNNLINRNKDLAIQGMIKNEKSATEDRISKAKESEKENQKQFNLGKKAYESKDYEAAIIYLNSVSSKSLSYQEAKDLLQKSNSALESKRRAEEKKARLEAQEKKKRNDELLKDPNMRKFQQDIINKFK
jgi:hypothetical protein